MRLARILIIICFAYPSNILGQNISVSDSLLTELKNHTTYDESRFLILRRLAHVHPEPQMALDFSLQALELAKALENPLFQAKSFEEIGLNQRLLGNKTAAVEATIQALQLFENLGDQEAQAATLVQLGSNAVVDKNYNQAVRYFNRALNIYVGQSGSVALFNYALTKLNLGEAHRLANNLDSAIYWFQSSLDLADSLDKRGDKVIVIAYGTGNLGMVYNSLDQLDTARAYLSEAITLTRELGDPYTTSVYLADLGVVEQKKGNRTQAEAYLLEAHGMASQEGLKEQIRDISELLVNFYEAQEAFGLALTYQKIYQQYQDSLVNRENVQQVEQLKANYEINKRESEIDLLTTINGQQRMLAIGLTIGLVVVVGLAFVIYRTNGRLIQSNQNLALQKEIVAKREEEKGWLLHELNHRVKNNMQMIASLLSLQEGQLKGHPAEAAIQEGKYRVKALSLIHRKLYAENQHTEIVLDEYLEELTRNLIHGFGYQVTLKLKLHPIKLHIDKAVPLALIVNEWVTNALKYAYKGIENPELLLKSETADNQISILVQDNGVGITNVPASASSGFGSLLVQQLVRQLEGTMAQVPGDTGSTWELRFSV
jgi:two-component sensor histidine kinase